MAFEDNELLFGSDPTPRIVAIEMGDTGTVRFTGAKKMAARLSMSSRFIRSSGLTAMWPISA